MVNQKPSLDGVFHALSDPTRRALVARLVEGEASVSALAAPLAMSLPAVMQHLQVLEAAGLVTTQKVGRVRTCRMEPAVLRAAEDWLSGHRRFWERRLDLLGALLDETADDPPTTDREA